MKENLLNLVNSILMDLYQNYPFLTMVDIRFHVIIIKVNYTYKDYILLIVLVCIIQRLSSMLHVLVMVN
jgi:hypothetical protein